MGLSDSRAAGPGAKNQVKGLAGGGQRQPPRAPRVASLQQGPVAPIYWGPKQKESLHVLARKGHYDAAHCLISQRSPKAVNRQDSSGRTPLFWATEYRHEDLVELLLSHGAFVAARDHEGNTCLHWAASVGCTPIARRLLEAGADANKQNNHGDTPLHLAARERRYQCLVLLLAHGASVSVKNKAGQTPMQCARLSCKHWSCMKALTSLPLGLVEKTLSNDISRGFEPVPIPCLNGVDSEPCPSDFLYVTHYILSDSVAFTTTDWIRKQCCQCTKTCSLSKCPCVQRSRRKWYTLDGHLVPTSSSVIESGHIYECHVLCSCSTFCPNRVVQRGIRTQLQLYRTPDKGWGVRTVQDLPRGTFICQYFGELISPEESETREDHTYMYRVETQEGEEYYLDGLQYSCVGRFLNHSCDPNLVPLRVAVGYEVPGIAFFTSRCIQAGEELGFDYGDPYWEWRGPDACKCQSPHCRFRSCPPKDASSLCSKMGSPIGRFMCSCHSLQASLPGDQPPSEDSLVDVRAPTLLSCDRLLLEDSQEDTGSPAVSSCDQLVSEDSSEETRAPALSTCERLASEYSSEESRVP